MLFYITESISGHSKIFGKVLYYKDNINSLKINIQMGNLLYVIAVILIIIWAISFLGGFYTGGLIHILLVIAVIAIIFKLINRV